MRRQHAGGRRDRASRAAARSPSRSTRATVVASTSSDAGLGRRSSGSPGPRVVRSQSPVSTITVDDGRLRLDASVVCLRRGTTGGRGGTLRRHGRCERECRGDVFARLARHVLGQPADHGDRRGGGGGVAHLEPIDARRASRARSVACGGALGVLVGRDPRCRRLRVTGASVVREQVVVGSARTSAPACSSSCRRRERPSCRDAAERRRRRGDALARRPATASCD